MEEMCNDMMYKWFGSGILLLFLVEILIAGCSNPDASSILEKVQQRIADSKTISKIYTNADCNGPDGPFYTQIWSSEEGFVRFEQRSSRDSTIAGINDSQGWMLEGKEVIDIELPNQVFLQSHELHFLAFNPLSRFNNHGFLGKSEFEGKQALQLQFRDRLNNPVDIFYHPEKHYPLGMMLANPFDKEAEKIKVLFQDWKQLDSGLFFFTKASFLQGDQVWSYDYSTIDVNNFADSIFNP